MISSVISVMWACWFQNKLGSLLNLFAISSKVSGETGEVEAGGGALDGGGIDGRRG